MATNIRLGKGKRTDGRLIRETEGRLAKLVARLAIETDPERLAKVSLDVEIKTRFLEKLRSEQ